MSDAAAISRPTNCSYANAMIGYEHPLAGQIEKALKLFPRAVEIEPQSLLAAWGIGQTLAAASAGGEACEWFRRAVDRSSLAPFSLGRLLTHVVFVDRVSQDRCGPRSKLPRLRLRARNEMSSEKPGQSCTFGYVAYQE